MASNSITALPIIQIDHSDEVPDNPYQMSTNIASLNDGVILKSRSNTLSRSSNSNENLTNFSSGINITQQFSFQGGGILSAGSTNYVRFHRARRIALWSCVISFVLDIGLGLMSFFNCVKSKSFVGFSYSVDTLMDALCTIFVAWHLKATSICDIHRRDRLACCVIGALFIGSFLAIESRAIQNMILARAARPDLIVAMYSLIHILVFTVLSVIKIIISKQIQSTSLMANALNSITGLIMSFPLLFWDRLTFLNKFAHLDDLVQVLMALFLFILGWKLILDSITTMNTEYARFIREEKLKSMLKVFAEEMDIDFEEVENDNRTLSIVPLAGARRFSVISNLSKM